MTVKDTIVVQRCGLSAKELNELLSSYPTPLKYDAILPTSTQTIFDAPSSYVGWYIHSFSLANLRLPLTDFFCELMVVNPLLTSFEVSSIFVKRVAGKLSKKGLKNTFQTFFPRLLLVLRAGMNDSSLFKTPLSLPTGLKPSWEFGQQWHAIIVGGKEMDFRNFIYSEDDDDLAFLPKEPSQNLPVEITTDSRESLKTGVFIVHPGSVATSIKERKCKTMGGSSRPFVKRKLAFGSSSSHAVRAKASASKDDAPILSISDNDERIFLVHLVLSEVTKKMSGEADVIKARERSREEECEELRVKCEAAMAEFDQNPIGLVLREKISSLTADVKEQKEAKKARLEAVKASLCREVEELKQDMRDVVLKLVPYAAMKLVHSDELVRLVGTLVSSVITYGRCRAYEQVAAMKEPFDLSKAKEYRSSYKKEHTQAINDFSTATFPWLDEFIAYFAALIKALLSKKPPMLQNHAPLRTQTLVPYSKKATPSSAPSLNPMYPPADLVKPSPSLFERRSPCWC
uniref:Transposase (Putative), gypsy type n=1 Tax=Tanacetum cinerariifolium TaxID=118510 RepID=A0A699IW40_TANCI|nr:hypothetical protein [Tanacetum cinerariifolium]